MPDLRPSAPVADVVARIARGDRSAFIQFYDAYAGLAFGLIRRIVRDEAAAEVLQEVFWQVWRQAGVSTRRAAAPRPGWSCGRRRGQSSG